jgi:protein arginine kinase activator
MECQGCGRKDALIHLTEISRGRVVNLWLCPDCARKRQDRGRNHGEADGALFGDPGRSGDFSRGDGDLLASFLGEHGLEPLDSGGGNNETCPACGYSLVQFRMTGRLGCPDCYHSFSATILPLLSRFHGRIVHLGKAPRSGVAGHDSLAEMTRTRVALEKAVAAEDFEEAARLRDLLKELQGKRNLDRGGGA